jgi:hypothetical protein
MTDLRVTKLVSSVNDDSAPLTTFISGPLCVFRSKFVPHSAIQ